MFAPINKVIPFSCVDGPGNRTVIFFQGCNIDCKYCHNPETRSVCNCCGDCVKNCPVSALVRVEDKIVFMSKKCIHCDTCIKVCKFDASPKVEWLSPEQVFEKIKEQVPFIRGITVSGGECMLYPEFLLQLFILCKNYGLGTLIDTNGTVDFKNHLELLKVVDGVMLDIKGFTKEEHLNLTGSENEKILENAIFLAKKEKLQEIRTVVIEEIIHPENVITSIGELLKENKVEISKIRYKLISFRTYGVRENYKYIEEPSDERMESLMQIAKKVGFKDIIVI